MAEHRMTASQARATEPNLTAWVGASAGTGKTHVLTARVLRLMLTGTSPENIICLTFTKAAAAEMTNRIFTELGKWALMDDQTLWHEVNRRTEEHADEHMLVRARQLFAEVLDLSPGLQIQTFHSFCQSLLGRFPLEAGMAPGFEAVDDTEKNELMASAKDEMLASTRKVGNQSLADALGHVAKLVTENTFDEVIDRLAYEAPALARAEGAYGGADGLEAVLFHALDITPGDNLTGLHMAAVRDEAFDVSGVQRLGAALSSGTAKESKSGEKLTAFTATGEAERLALFEQYAQVFLTAKQEPRKAVANKGTLANDPSLEDIIAKEQARLAYVAEQSLRIKAAVATAALLKLGLSQLTRYRHLKTARGLVDFDDMIQNTVALFRQADVAPWILFKLDAAVEHILVDEAQDTNRDQWRVVEALSAEFFAGEGASDTVRTLFAVGDAKQSIFSFQRADPKEFIAARERVFRRSFEADMQSEAVPLNLSFRSGQAVLSLVDAVFSAETRAAIGLSPDGETVSHDFVRKGHAGLVELWPLEAPKDKSNDDTPEWAMPLVQESVDDAQERTAWRIARRISEMITSGEKLTSQNRPIRAGDFLVLVRRRTPFVDHLVRALKSLAVPVAGRDRMVLTDELAVMDILVLARFALQPTDDLSLATVLKGPFVGLDEDALFELAHGRKGSLWQALLRQKSAAAFTGVAEMLKGLLDGIDVKTPFEFFNHILTEMDGRRKLVARLGDEIHDPVDELLEEALRFELTTSASMQAFVHSVEHAGTQIKRDMEAAGNNVRIMTVHSAKGLQAPIVFLSDLVGLPNSARDTQILPLASSIAGAPPLPFWTSPGKGLAFIDTLKDAVKEKQMAEYRRLLYVALTRAEDRLYVAGWQAKGEPSEDCWATAIEQGFSRLETEKIDLPGGIQARRFEVPQVVDVKGGEAMAAVEPVAATPAWLFDAMPDEPAPARPLAPSRPEDEPAVTGPLARTGSRRFQRGRYIHALLEWLPDVPADQRKVAALRYLTKSASDLDEEQRRAVWQEVDNIISGSSFAALFGPSSLAEVPIAGIVSGRAISGQVDRLVVKREEVLVVDYKTNRPPPSELSGVDPVYLRQMGLYARALESIYPGKKIRAALLWTDVATLMELPKSLMEEALTRSGL